MLLGCVRVVLENRNQKRIIVVMNGETLQYLTLKGLKEDERVWNKTSDHSHFYEWATEYYKNGLIDRDRLITMIKKRREKVDDELFFLDLILGAKV